MAASDAKLREGPLLYSPQRALEIVAATDGLLPVRLFSVLFPLWEVEVTGMQRRSQPYEMLDSFLERGIAEGELGSAAGLSAFFGLERNIMDKALARLQTMGHVQAGTDGGLALTELGRASLADGVCYRDLETRRKLYFEALNSRPLPQEHYRLRILSEVEAMSYSGRNTLLRLYRFRSWQRQAVADLERRPDRAKWNLPDEVRDLEERSVAPAYLPLYIVEARDRATPGHFGARYMVLSRVRGLQDTFFEELVNSEPDLLDPLYAEAKPDVKARMEEKIAGWDLGEKVRLAQPAPDAWRAIVAPEVFLGLRPSLTMADIGQYELVDGYCLQIWCDDPALRREAALDRALTSIAHWQRPTTQQTVGQLLETLVTRLQTREMDVAELSEWASKRKAIDALAKLKELEA
jgi:hypothetical protein